MGLAGPLDARERLGWSDCRLQSLGPAAEDCSTLCPPPGRVSPAADLLHPLAAPQPGEDTALGRASPGAQCPRDHLRHAVRPLQPRCPCDRRCCPTSPLAILAGDEHHQDTSYFS